MQREPLPESVLVAALLFPGSRLNRSQNIQLSHVLRLESFGKDRLAVHMQGGEKALVSSASRTPELRRWLEGVSFP